MIELLFALAMIAVAVAMIWGARKRSRKSAPGPKVGEPHTTIDPLDASAAARSSAAMARRSRGGDGHDGDGDGGGNGGD